MNHRSGGPRAALACAAVAACAALASTASAQGAATTGLSGATPLERLQPAPAGDALFTSPSAGLNTEHAIDAGVLFSFAHAPLTLRTRSAAGAYEDGGAVVAHQAVLHALVSASLFGRLKVELDMPLTVDQGGDSPSTGGAAIASPSGFSANDLRIGARFTALPPSGLLPGAAIAFSTWVPTGDASAFTSTGSARFEPRLVVGADSGPLVYSASIGRMFGDPDAGLLGSEVTFSAGVAGRIDRFQIGPEVFGSVIVDRAESAAAGGVTVSPRAGGGLEALLGAKAHFGPVTAGLAGGAGFLRGVGTPDFRLVASIVVRPFEVKSASGSGDGNGARSGGAGDGASKGAAQDGGAVTSPPPPADLDGDGVLDAEDACPRVVGDPSPTAKRRGCPPDRDGDAIPDAEDRCPDRPGIPAEGDKNGCPPDTDGDGLVDPDDACPNEAGPKTDDPKTTGCPAAVRVEGSQIVILQQVNFETAKARILPSSFSLLQQVADVLAQHPEIARVAVDGHTDDRGTVASNMDLSRARAVSVMRWLTEKGVDARRLEARGFGPKRPVADNKTDAGRAKNRRVEFQIRKRTDKGEAGWADGPVD
jgi:outer membrane protein OmpA-like peptidoglycan-associated protein